MRSAILMGPLACLVFVLGCQTAPDSGLMRQRIADTRSWHLVSSTRYDPGGAPVRNEYSEWKVKRADWYAWLLNTTSRLLKSNYGIILAEDTAATSGELCFNVTEAFDGTINIIELAVIDSNKQPITRRTIFRNGELPPHPWPLRLDSKDEGFADYIAGKTAAVLVSNGASTQ